MKFIFLLVILLSLIIGILSLTKGNLVLGLVFTILSGIIIIFCLGVLIGKLMSVGSDDKKY